MKIAFGLIAAVVGLFVFGIALHGPWLQGSEASHMISTLHGQSADTADNGAVTVSMAQNDFDLCDEDFYIGFYEVTRSVYAANAGAVSVAELESATFNYIRNYPAMSDAEAEAWVEHIDLIPGQLVDIIAEDPEVIDSCANFSVALVGPP